MHETHKVENLKQSLKERVQIATGVRINDCYQCGKCTAGCPLAEDMDLKPSQVLRLLQLDREQDEERILRSLGIWLCLTCETCYTRCPKEVEFPIVMDYLRAESIRKDMVHKGARKILAFHKTFLDSIRLTGRLQEVGLVAGYKMRTLDLLKDVEKAPDMFFKGKLNIFPHRIKGIEHIAKIFENIQKEEEAGK